MLQKQPRNLVLNLAYSLNQVRSGIEFHYINKKLMIIIKKRDFAPNFYSWDICSRPTWCTRKFRYYHSKLTNSSSVCSFFFREEFRFSLTRMRNFQRGGDKKKKNHLVWQVDHGAHPGLGQTTWIFCLGLDREKRTMSSVRLRIRSFKCSDKNWINDIYVSKERNRWFA